MTVRVAAGPAASAALGPGLSPRLRVKTQAPLPVFRLLSPAADPPDWASARPSKPAFRGLALRF